MNFDVAIDQGLHFVRITVSGRPAFEDLLSMIHLLGVESEAWNEDRVLMDLRAVQPVFTLQDHYRIGEEVAASLSHMDRIASLVPPERVTRMSEKAARRSGTNARVFDEEREAVAWLQAARV
jgi:hypothetical protein